MFTTSHAISEFGFYIFIFLFILIHMWLSEWWITMVVSHWLAFLSFISIVFIHYIHFIIFKTCSYILLWWSLVIPFKNFLLCLFFLLLYVWILIIIGQWICNWIMLTCLNMTFSFFFLRHLINYIISNT